MSEAHLEPSRTSMMESFFEKIGNGQKPATLLKKWLWHRCFPVNLAKCLKITL